jgi:TRAP-type C4-dicarboxylate transport system permease small subunit
MKQTLYKIWDHLEEYVLVYSLMVSVALVFVQVVMRRVFNNSLSWSEELARYLYVWQTWLGVSYAARNGTHLRITMLKDRLPAKAQQILEILVVLVWMGFGIFVIYQGMGVVNTIASFGQKSSALKIPMQFCYMSIPVGMFLMCIRIVERTVKDQFLQKKEAAE